MDYTSHIEKLRKEYDGASKLIETAHGLWRGAILASAVEVGLFDYLETEGNRSKTEAEIREGIHLNAPRV